ncbi:outer membrane beta-barrel protein [Alistipes sp.]|uniref:outer membrane beta-barrel protein n=1 Tax=Alistipes sp. TaxID=1872444 RepID=UPI003AB69399
MKPYLSPRSFSLLTVLLALLTIGCSPAIYTNVSNSYPTASHGTTVAVFRSEPTTPPAEILGTVIVKDTGFSRFNYKTAVATAAEKIVHIGGNGLHIEYFRKSGFLPSGLLEGQMLRFADSLYKDLLADSLCSACTVPESRLAKSSTEKPMPKHSFYANAAYAFILSKFMVPAGATGDASRGFEFNAGYNYTPKKTWGYGGRYARFASSIDLHEGHRTYKDRITLQYLAPEATIRVVGARWAFHAALGLGYASYSEKIGDVKATIEGVGVHLALAVEYRISKSLGIALDCYEIISLFDDERISAGNEVAGIKRMGFAGGLRVHF